MIKSIFITLLLVFFLVLPAAYPDERTHRPHETRQVTLAGKDLTALVADTDLLITQGLAGFDGLDDDQVMLFVFDQPGIHGFWMKQMRFAVDIAWISENLEIIHIQARVEPESYPKIFTPLSPALYVIETRSGLLDSLGVAPGDTVGIH